MSTFKSYIKLFKEKKITKQTTPEQYLIFVFIDKHINEDGYITITEDLYDDFLQLILEIILYLPLSENIDNKTIQTLLLDNTDILYKFPLNEKILYNNFFEKYLEISNLITSHLYFDYIAQAIYQIYLYGTTINNLETYFQFNTLIEYNNPDHIKLLSDYILSNNVFENPGFTGTSYKLLTLGHLLKKTYQINKQIKEDIIIEHPHIAFARITLQLIINTKISDQKIIEIFNDLKYGYYAPATPIYYNSLLKNNNLLSSCFLFHMSDSVKGIFKTLGDISSAQQHNAGIGVTLAEIRAEGRNVMNGVTETKSFTNIVDMLAIISNMFRNNKRQRSVNTNITMSINHPDIDKFFHLKWNNHLKDESYYSNIFQTTSMPDEFMYRFLTNRPYYLISPEQTLNNKHLYDVYGNQESNLYNQMIENDSIDKIEIDPSDLWLLQIQTYLRTGSSFIFFKDIVNATSNQLEVPGKVAIPHTNLCTEVLQKSNKKETGVCNLTSINLKKFITTKDNKKIFDFPLFQQKIKNIVFILSNTIDQGYYSDPKCEYSNKKNRPIGIGIQGLTNLFYELEIPYLQGKQLYQQICEFLYYTCLQSSTTFARYNVFKKYEPDVPSPLHQGLFSFNLYKQYQTEKKQKLQELNLFDLADQINLSDYDPKFISKELWNNLKDHINTHGLVTSLCVAFMPTSLSSGIYDNVESFEPFQYNIIKRTFSNYDILFYNSYLVNDLLNLKLYSLDNVISELIKVKGNISQLQIPIEYKKLLLKKYQTIYEMDIDEYTRFHASVNFVIDQGKSTNLYIKNNNKEQLSKTLIDHWLLGTKTLYYNRTYIENDIINTDNIIIPDINVSNNNQSNKSICYNKSDCLACSS